MLLGWRGAPLLLRLLRLLLEAQQRHRLQLLLRLGGAVEGGRRSQGPLGRVGAQGRGRPVRRAQGTLGRLGPQRLQLWRLRMPVGGAAGLATEALGRYAATVAVTQGACPAIAEMLWLRLRAAAVAGLQRLVARRVADRR